MTKSTPFQPAMMRRKRLSEKPKRVATKRTRRARASPARALMVRDSRFSLRLEFLFLRKANMLVSEGEFNHGLAQIGVGIAGDGGGFWEEARFGHAGEGVDF